MRRCETNESLLPTTPISIREFRRKIASVILLTFFLCSALLFVSYLSGCFDPGPSMADLAKQQALEYYSRSHRRSNFRPRGLFLPKQNAVIVILCRNEDLDALIGTLGNFDDQFNKRNAYPYVFLNNKPFTYSFQKTIQNLVAGLSRADVKFGLVPRDHWSYPVWINQTHAGDRRKSMERRNVIYGGSESYRHMCRYFSGFLHKHPLLKEYEYYWRVEPGVAFTCKIPYDPFLVLSQGNKKYGFVISFGELPDTIPTLWDSTRQFMEEHPNLLKTDNCFDYFVDQHGEFNYCHFWSNFEIASFSLFRSPEYQAYFDHLDKQGGFFYERWGDAPIHSLAVGMFLRKDDVAYFEDIGYRHEPFSHCPIDSNWRRDQNCMCNPFHENDQTHSQCLRRWNGLSEV